jgi:hypothetical protein
VSFDSHSTSCVLILLIALIQSFRNFRICLVYELVFMIGDAIPYCTKAISLCKSRMQSLKSSKDALLNGKDGNDAPAAEAEGGSEKSAAEKELEQLTSICNFRGCLDGRLSRRRPPHFPRHQCGARFERHRCGAAWPPARRSKLALIMLGMLLYQ